MRRVFFNYNPLLTMLSVRAMLASIKSNLWYIGIVWLVIYLVWNIIDYINDDRMKELYNRIEKLEKAFKEREN